MKNIKKKLVGVGVALSLVLGGALVTAPAAQAVNYYNCYWQFNHKDAFGWWYTKWCWADYSWWEEVSYPWPSDGWVVRGRIIR